MLQLGLGLGLGSGNGILFLLFFFFLLCKCGGHHFVVLSWPALSMSHVSMTSSGMKRGEQSGSPSASWWIIYSLTRVKVVRTMAYAREHISTSYIIQDGYNCFVFLPRSNS